jgi:hypothetical protein
MAARFKTAAMACSFCVCSDIDIPDALWWMAARLSRRHSGKSWTRMAIRAGGAPTWLVNRTVASGASQDYNARWLVVQHGPARGGRVRMKKAAGSPGRQNFGMHGSIIIRDPPPFRPRRCCSFFCMPL